MYTQKISQIVYGSLFPDNWLDLLSSLKNPSIFAVIFVVMLVVFVYLISFRIIMPMQKKHLEKLQETEIRGTKLMALFAELDPDPVIRFDKEGNIIFANAAGAKLISSQESQSLNEELEIQFFNFETCIENGSQINLERTINGKVYQLHIKGEPELGIGQIYFSNITDLKKIQSSLKLSKQKLQSLSNHLQNVLEEERTRVSRELHDSIGQHLSYARLGLQKLNEAKLSKNDYERNYSLIQESLFYAISELRDISQNLRPKILEKFGIKSAVENLVEEANRREKIKGIFQVFGEIERYDPELEIAVYRIAQELISNIIKHSEANEYYVQLFRLNETLRLTIEDNGIGFNYNEKDYDPQKKSGMGLINISERVEAFKGFAEFDTAPNKGTYIFIELPVSNKIINKAI